MAKPKSKSSASLKGFSLERAAELYKRLAKQRPDPGTELNYKDPYTLLVAVVMSAQTTDVSVNKATETLYKVADTPAKMIALGERKIGEHIRKIGFWRGKAKNVVALSKILLEQHGGKVPSTRDELEALPGVGRKTAGVVLNEIYGEATIAVDTHVFRVSNRTGLAPGETPEDVETRLLEVTPDKYKTHAHHWLILHGRYTCLARKPGCPECVIRDLCEYEPKTVSAPKPQRA